MAPEKIANQLSQTKACSDKDNLIQNPQPALIFADLFTIWIICCNTFPRSNVYSILFPKDQTPTGCRADIHKLAEFFSNASTFFSATLVSDVSHSNKPPMKSVGLS